MRLDKFLCETRVGTRSQVKAILKQKTVTVNEKVVTSPDFQINEAIDIVTYRGKVLSYRKFYYFMLNKPAGVVSATKDNIDKTVLELLSAEDRRQDLFPVGRLDKDTEGFLLISNDGDLSHRLLSPRKHVDKTYLVHIEKELSTDDISALEQGVDIGEDHLTKPAKVKILDSKRIELTITEGKYHQVKRMLQAVDNKVLYLKRISFGGLILDENLQTGDYRELTESELQILNEN